MQGVWTEFEIKSVQKTNLTKYLQSDQKYLEGKKDFEEAKRNNLNTLKNEPFDQIQEWNQFRFRIGKPDKILSKGIYWYKIKLSANKNSQNQYNFKLLRDWNDTISSMEVFRNGTLVCSSLEENSLEKKCNSNYQITLNSNKTPVNFIVIFWLNWWIFILVFGIISIFGYLAWFIFAKDPNYGFITDKPEFEPPNLFPWESQFLVTNGKLGFKETLLSYILYLSNYQFIKIIPPKLDNSISLTGTNNQNNQINIQILKPLPEILPKKFNNCLVQISQKGFEKGIYDSKISASDIGQVTSNIQKKFKNLYAQGFAGIGGILTIVAVVIVLLVTYLIFENFRKQMLIGESYLSIFPLIVFTTIMWLIIVFANFSKLTRQGAELKAYCQRYNYYIQKAEQYKLDFSNNPQEGVQYYLKILPYAAIIGFLPQFQKFLQTLLPNIQELNQVSSLATSLNTVTFYTPPSSSSSSSSDSSWSGGGFSGGGGSW
jgi:uncharacterized membrane protein YgcG